MILLVGSLIVATMLQAAIPAQRSSPDVVPQTRGILTAIVAGDFATVEKQFTDDMKTALPPSALAGMWAKLLNQAGAYKSCGTDPRVRRIDDKEMVITPCEFERTTIDIQFAFDSAGRISGLKDSRIVHTAVVRETVIVCRKGDDPRIQRVGPSCNTDHSSQAPARGQASSWCTGPVQMTATKPWAPTSRSRILQPGSRRAASPCCVTTSERWFTAPRWRR